MFLYKYGRVCVCLVHYVVFFQVSFEYDGNPIEIVKVIFAVVPKLLTPPLSI